MTSLEDNILIRAIKKKKEVLKEVKQTLMSKFIDFSSLIFANLNWFDPEN